MEFDLYDLKEQALILPLPTGITYVQQTGGLCCHQHRCQGAIVLVPDVFLTRPLMTLATDDDAITEDGADEIDKSWVELQHLFRMSVDRQKLAQSEEAWVHVQVVLPQYAGGAVLTWENSD